MTSELRSMLFAPGNKLELLNKFSKSKINQPFFIDSNPHFWSWIHWKVPNGYLPKNPLTLQR